MNMMTKILATSLLYWIFKRMQATRFSETAPRNAQYHSQNDLILCIGDWIRTQILEEVKVAPMKQPTVQTKNNSQLYCAL